MDELSSGMPGRGPVTQLLRRWTDGDDEALHRLVPLVYKELQRLAGRHLGRERDGHTLQRTGLVHEVFLRLSPSSGVQWQSRAQFFGLASRLMRHILVDHARARLADKRGGGAQVVSLDEIESVPEASPAIDRLDVLALDEALQRLERIDPRQSEVIELRFFGGLNVEETAAALDISPATVKREWACGRAWLLRELGDGRRDHAFLAENHAA